MLYKGAILKLDSDGVFQKYEDVCESIWQYGFGYEEWGNGNPTAPLSV